IGAPLLIADMARAKMADMSFERAIRLAFREAWFLGAVLYVKGMDALRGDEQASLYQRLLDALVEDSGITILAGAEPWVPTGAGTVGMIVVPFPIPDFARRRIAWQSQLVEHDIALDAHDLDALADRFRLTLGQIAEAVVTACNRARWRTIADIELPTTD